MNIILASLHTIYSIEGGNVYVKYKAFIVDQNPRYSIVRNKRSHLSNKRGGWNKRGGGAKSAKSLNVEGVINIIF